MMTNHNEGLGSDLLNTTAQKDHAITVQEFSDAFSLWDWGKMPDSIPFKAESSAIIAADGFEKVESPAMWREFSKSAEALALRKANRLGGVFNELGEELQQVGLRTQYLGILPASTSHTLSAGVLRSSEVSTPFRKLGIRRSEVIRPASAVVFGKSLPDYFLYRSAPAPKKVPLEFCFYWNSGKQSSVRMRANSDLSCLNALGVTAFKFQEDESWDFPLIEMKTKYENPERSISLTEGLAVSGLSASQLQRLLLNSIWTAAMMKYLCLRQGFELIEGKLEWAVSEEGHCFLTSSLGPDELKIMHGSIQFSKDILKTIYRSSRWFQAVEKSRLQAKTQGLQDWKKWVQETPPPLPPPVKEITSQVYRVLAQKLTGKIWFKDVWSFEKTLEQAQQLVPSEVRA